YETVGIFLPESGAGCLRNSAYFGYGGCCNDPGTGSVALVGGVWKIYTDGNANGKYDAGEDGITNTNPDDDYSDLICQPFKQVKDAARNFIHRLDFTRGDRVGLVTFARVAEVVYPNENSDKTSPLYRPPMMNSEELATTTLNKYVGIHINETGIAQGCKAFDAANKDIEDGVLDYSLRPESYEVYALCTNTNIGDGLRRANELLTNVDTIRREAVWVAIILSDGATNSALTRKEDQLLVNAPGIVHYLDVGFCPWSTFCHQVKPENNATLDRSPYYFLDVDGTGAEAYWNWDSLPVGERFPNYPECRNSYATVVAGQTSIQSNEPASQYCHDMDPTTRHMCLEWVNGPGNGQPGDITNPSSQCGERGHYDPDDYARDMADWAGLIELTPTVPGNFIAMFAIGFGEEIANPAQPAYATAMPLLHYIADAGDNGLINNVRESQWRGQPRTGDPCETVTDPTEWCGQYYYASDLASLEQVFEDIASRLFTRLSR
ncbi:MAG: VWA domain-containing protein, partial [Anaerolineae bacterium]|nr:VWA domain-containing protein [Anaerolineae bacterium]